MNSGKSCGFTLVEVIISLTLVSLIMLGLIGALSTFADAGARLDRRSVLLDEFRVVPRFLEGVIGSASSRARPPGVGSAQWFIGASERLSWLGTMPARHGAGGLTHFMLSTEPRGRQLALVLRMAPFVDDATDPEWEDAQPEVVVDGLSAVAFAYRALDEEEWVGDWQERPGLPGWVAVSMSSSGEYWPFMVFRLFEAR